MRTVIAFTVLFVVILVVVSIAGLLFTKAVRAVGLGLADRTLGGVFGFARGALILLVIALAAGLTAVAEGAVLARGEARPAARNGGDCSETLPSAGAGG